MSFETCCDEELSRIVVGCKALSEAEIQKLVFLQRHIFHQSLKSIKTSA